MGDNVISTQQRVNCDDIANSIYKPFAEYEFISFNFTIRSYYKTKMYFSIKSRGNRIEPSM